jgi:hypothetical protein
MIRQFTAIEALNFARYSNNSLVLSGQDRRRRERNQDPEYCRPGIDTGQISDIPLKNALGNYLIAFISAFTTTISAGGPQMISNDMINPAQFMAFRNVSRYPQ